VETVGRIAFGSKVAVGASGKGVSVADGVEVGVSPSEKGWNGVRVGVAFAGAVTRNRVVGVAAGSPAAVFPPGGTQPAIKMMSTIDRSVRFIKSIYGLLLIPVSGNKKMYPMLCKTVETKHAGLLLQARKDHQGVGNSSVSVGISGGMGVSVGILVGNSIGVSEGRMISGVLVGMLVGGGATVAHAGT